MDAAELAALRETLIRAREEHPALRRGIGQLLPELELELGVPVETPRRRRAPEQAAPLASALGGRGARRR